MDVQYDYHTNYGLILKKDFYYRRGLSGLINVGNKCYSNSILHLLAHTLRLTDYFLSGKLKKDAFENNFSKRKEFMFVLNYIKLLSAVWNNNELLKPNLNVQISDELIKYNNNDQHDSHEFLIDLLNTLSNAISYKINVTISGTIQNETDYLMKESIMYWKKTYENNYSEIINIFNGMTINLVECKNCKYQSNIFFECFNSLTIDLVNETSENSVNCILNDRLDNYFKTCSIDDWKCEKCFNNGCVKGLNIWSLPTHLIIVLKRFDNNGNKLKNHVDFPIDDLDLTRYICQKKGDPNNYIYSLYGINYHSGNLRNGHYWCSIKNSDNNWYQFNDGNVTKYNFNAYNPSDIKGHLVTSDAYILFYHRKFII